MSSFRERVKNRMRDEYDRNDCGAEEDRCEICLGRAFLHTSNSPRRAISDENVIQRLHSIDALRIADMNFAQV